MHVNWNRAANSWRRVASVNPVSPSSVSTYSARFVSCESIRFNMAVAGIRWIYNAVDHEIRCVGVGRFRRELTVYWRLAASAKADVANPHTVQQSG
jgi:hypothetical protein